MTPADHLPHFLLIFDTPTIYIVCGTGLALNRMLKSRLKCLCLVIVNKLASDFVLPAPHIEQTLLA